MIEWLNTDGRWVSWLLASGFGAVIIGGVAGMFHEIDHMFWRTSSWRREEQPEPMYWHYFLQLAVIAIVACVVIAVGIYFSPNRIR